MMTRYEFYKKVANALSKKNVDAIFEYIIHSMDDNGGFLRSRFCYWDKTLPDREFIGEPEVLLVALRSSFDFENSTDYYEKPPAEFSDYPYTNLKMQVFYTDASKDSVFNSDAQWSAEVGFPYPVRVNLKKGTCEMLDYIDSRG